MFNHALIMAGGEGTRMRPLTNYVPKAMIEVGSQELIKYSFDLLQSNNDKIKIHVTVGYKSEILAPFLLKNQCVKSIINTKDKNNGWWIFNSLLKNLDEPIVVLTCDNIMGLDLKKIYSDYVNLGNPSCMIVPIDQTQTTVNTEGDYLLIDEKNNINYIGRGKMGIRMASGCQIINPYKINKYIKEGDDFNYIWNELKIIKQLKCSKIEPTIWKSFDSITQILNLKNE